MDTSDRNNFLIKIAEVEKQIANLHQQQVTAETTLRSLRERLAQYDNENTCHEITPSAAPVPAAANLTPEDKVALFLRLFRGREDVYPKLWQNQQADKKGYSPACSNEWIRGVCEKPRVRCGECPNQAFLPVTADTILDHLQGRHVIGVYPMLKDETCCFLAADFDKEAWREDVMAFTETCRRAGVPYAIERSRSGNGAHVWFFFSSPVSATTARKMGSYLLTETMARRHQLSMASYDRLFPNQDTLPSGGFGNLIALPLQYHPRQEGNTIFLDDELEPIPDQWGFLDSLARIPADKVKGIAQEATTHGQVMGLQVADMGEDDIEAKPWLRPPSQQTKQVPITEPIPLQVQGVLSQRIYIEKAGLPSPLINQIKRLAAFQNPEFYKKQNLRLSTALTPRIISCAEDHGKYISLPRGCLDDVLNLLDECHHIPARSFERVLSAVKARYVVGLTATPQRRDGHHPIIKLQIGPIRVKTNPRSQLAQRPFDHRLVVRETGFDPPTQVSATTIQELYGLLAADEKRNELIFNDVLMAMEEGRSPILLTERKDHLENLHQRLKGFVRHIVILRGGRSEKERRDVQEQLTSIPIDEERLLIAIGKYIGEGFDDARLDTLFLALPVSWKGTLVQYAGRLHRLHPGKREVRIVDYVDSKIPMLAKMFEKRSTGYRSMGYREEDAGALLK